MKLKSSPRCVSCICGMMSKCRCGRSHVRRGVMLVRKKIPVSGSKQRPPVSATLATTSTLEIFRDSASLRVICTCKRRACMHYGDSSISLPQRSQTPEHLLFIFYSIVLAWSSEIGSRAASWSAPGQRRGTNDADSGALMARRHGSMG